MSENTKVVSLSGDAIVTVGQPYPAMIEDMEKLLEQIRSGHINGIIYAVNYFDGTSSYQLAGRVTRSVMGSLEIAKFKAIKDDIENE